MAGGLIAAQLQLSVHGMSVRANGRIIA